jgi:hypothetical protein
MDHVATGLSRLTSEFKGKKKLVQYLSGVLALLNNIETDLLALRTQRWIASAVGVQLDGCGYIVGVDRLGRNDDDYRAAIMERAQWLSIIGTPEAVITALRFLTGADDTQYMEPYPATAMVLTEGFAATPSIVGALQPIAPAGVSDIAVMIAYGSQPLRTALAREERQVLSANGARLGVQSDKWLDVGTAAPESFIGSRLSGLVPPRLLVNGRRLRINTAKRLVIRDPDLSFPLDSGYHMPGVFQ